MATLKEQIAALQKGWSAEIANQEQPGIQTDIKTGSLSFDNKNWMVFQYPGGGVTVLRRSPNQAGLGANSYRAEILDPETGKIEETVVSPSRIADIGGKVLLATMAVLAANPQLAASLGGAEAAAAAAGELAGADLAIALGEGIQPIASTAAQAGAVGSNLASLGAGIGLSGAAPGLLSTIGGALSAVPTSALVTGGLLAANAASNALAPRQTTDASGNVTYNMPQPLLFQSRQYTPATGNLYRYGFGPEQAMFKGVGDTSQIGRQSVTAGGATPADQLTQQKLTPAVIATPPPAVSPTAPVGLAQSGLTSTGLLGVNTGGQVTPIVQPVDQGTIGLLNQGVQVDINPNRGVTDAEARQIFKAIFGAEPTEGQFANFSNNRDMFKNPNELGVYLIQERERLGLTPVKQEQQVTTTGPATSGAGTSVTPIQTSVGGSPTIVNAPLNMGGLLDTFSAAPPVATYISPESASQIFQNVFGFAPNQQQITNFNTGNMFTTPAEFQGYLLGEAQRLNIPTLIS